AEDGIRDSSVTGVQTCALPILTEQARAITMRGLRIVWRVLLLAIVLYVWIAEKHHPTNKQIGDEFYTAVCIVSICLIGTMFSGAKTISEAIRNATQPS